MASREHQDWEPDVYGDPTEERKRLNGIGWVDMTPEQRQHAKVDPITRRLIANLERVVDGWSLE